MSDGEIFVTKSSLPPLEEYVNEIKDLWDTHMLTNMGTKHKRFEESLCHHLDVNYCSLLVNGHMALELAIQGFNLSGEIITTPFTFASTTHAIVRNGLRPVFCDINRSNYTIDASKLEPLITEHTSAIIPVHVYGYVCDVYAIESIAKKYNLKVIYDAAHAFGVKYKGIGIGNFGDASIFSFHATKVFNSIEGGAVTFNNIEYGKKLYQLKNFGIKSETIVDGIGSNAKMNEFQAAMGLCNLRHISVEIEKRQIIFNEYIKYLSNIPGIVIPYLQEDVQTNYSYFPILIDESKFSASRDEVYDELKKKNIYARKYFFPLTSSFDCYKGRGFTGSTPVAQHIAQQVLTLPLYSDLELNDVERICSVIKGL